MLVEGNTYKFTSKANGDGEGKLVKLRGAVALVQLPDGKEIHVARSGLVDPDADTAPNSQSTVNTGLTDNGTAGKAKETPAPEKAKEPRQQKPKQEPEVVKAKADKPAYKIGDLIDYKEPHQLRGRPKLGRVLEVSEKHLRVLNLKRQELKLPMAQIVGKHTPWDGRGNKLEG